MIGNVKIKESRSGRAANQDRASQRATTNEPLRAKRAKDGTARFQIIGCGTIRAYTWAINEIVMPEHAA